MRRDNIKARLLRAFSGKTQEQIGEEIGVHPMPGRSHLRRMARSADLTLPEALP